MKSSHSVDLRTLQPEPQGRLPAPASQTPGCTNSSGFLTALLISELQGAGERRLLGGDAWHLSCQAHSSLQPRRLCE